MQEPLVAIANTGAEAYPGAPFHPSRRFPEYSGQEFAPQHNAIYEGVRECFRLLGLDARKFGTPDWNPLGEWIRPGMNVLVKPNLVRHFHPYGFATDSLYTHGSVVRAVCDYVLIALQGAGQLVIADAPLQTCNFEEVCRLSGIKHVEDYYRDCGTSIAVRDLRLVSSHVQARSRLGRVLVKAENAGDPAGYTQVDLGQESLHAEREAGSRYRVTCYDPEKMSLHHSGGKHEYVIANTLLEADVVLNLPKMKTHHKAGLTGALKNFIGINGHKDCLPHHIQGAAGRGGDEYLHPSALKGIDSWILDQKERGGGVLVQKGAAIVHRALRAVHMREHENGFWEGSWYGNDTISRTTIDLNRIAMYADKQGRMCPVPQRAIFTLVDGVVAGDKDGPLAPDPRPTGLLIAGGNPVAVDLILARLMGFRWEALPTLRHATQTDQRFSLMATSPDQVSAASNDSTWHRLSPNSDGASLQFEPHAGWKGHIER
jgi:uncharacterized protein (DUF362 family)